MREITGRRIVPREMVTTMHERDPTVMKGIPGALLLLPSMLFYKASMRQILTHISSLYIRRKTNMTLLR